VLEVGDDLAPYKTNPLCQVEPTRVVEPVPDGDDADDSEDADMTDALPTTAPAGNNNTGYEEKIIYKEKIVKERVVVKEKVFVKGDDITNFVLAGKKMSTVIDEAETKVQPFNLKWWRYRWEYTCVESAVLVPLAASIY
jgi:hypothetical protein